MFCPRCGAEYRPAFVRCADCDVELVDAPPEPSPASSLVPVFETADPALLPLIESLLAAAGIPFEVRGEETLGLFPVGGYGTGMGRPSRGVSAIFLVSGERAAEARELLTAAQNGFS